MATVTYTFAGITNPSGTHIAYWNVNADLPPAGGGLVSANEVTDGNYTGLAASDNVYYEVWTNEADKHQLLQFDWLLDVPRADVTRLDITVEVWGYADSADGWDLYVRKNTGGGAPVWEWLATELTGDEVTLTGPITANLLDYITAGGRVYVLAVQRGVIVEEGASTLKMDFSKLDVTYTSVTAPTITISAATLITTISARLNGNVTATGGENPTVTCYWGLTDGGQTPGNWTNNAAPTSPGQPQGVAAFYKDIAALDPGTLYWFSAKATNSAGTGWPAASLSFTTERAYCQAQCVG